MRTTQILLSVWLTIAFISCGSKGNKSTPSTDSVNAPTASSTTVSEQPTVVKKYPIKSGIVTFENDMLGIKQKKVLYFDDYGIKEAEEIYEGENVKEVSLCDGKKRYTINFAQKTAYSTGDCYRGIAYKFDWDEISKADKEYKVKKLANVTVAGKDCQSYSLSSGNFPTVFAGWNNICLYQETKSQYGTVIMKAVKVEENASVPAEKLQVPAGFTVKNSGL
jgi:hypothetical protein